MSINETALFTKSLAFSCFSAIAKLAFLIAVLIEDLNDLLAKLAFSFFFDSFNLWFDICH
ncbi:hypothetical protein P344_00815 [Spiroplasma mirum ATCC 29335]|uniref:Uncharacterized protein n=1 Tax=Spiroplasma mirum ATCC 29335 TaxID=838561 RepID=W6AKH0_9MOLU|nr:hypothetical protein P344_00815 [Spiroplasma mirum ATCC 29335]